MPGPFERRQALRFPIPLHVELEKGNGIIRNISTSGVLFETDQVFPTGALIQLTVLMEPTCPGTPTCLHCQGQIVRAEQHEEKMGVAVAFTSYQFETLRDPGERSTQVGSNRSQFATHKSQAQIKGGNHRFELKERKLAKI